MLSLLTSLNTSLKSYLDVCLGKQILYEIKSFLSK